MNPVAGDGPRYVLHQRLAAGGMGVVHLGTLVTPAGKRRVAIKQLSSERSSDAWRRRLIEEARLAFRLTHGNICQVFDLGENEQGTFIVLEYVNGVDLRALQREHRGPIDAAVVTYVAREIARGLDYAHRKRDDDGYLLGLVHGDVTPQNVLLSVEGEVKLCDFGIARALGAIAPGDQLRGGTPGWVAPEAAITEGRIDHRADLYGLGVTIYALLTNKRPPEGVLPPDALARERPDLGGELARIVARLTAARPEDRFASAGEAEQELAFELARRQPGFTPLELSRLVRGHVHPVETSPVEQGTLASLSGAYTIPDEGGNPLALLTPHPEEPAAGGAYVPRGTATPPRARENTATHTVIPVPPARRRWGVIGGVIAVIALGAGAAIVVPRLGGGGEAADAGSAEGRRAEGRRAEVATGEGATGGGATGEGATPDALGVAASVTPDAAPATASRAPTPRPERRPSRRSTRPAEATTVAGTAFLTVSSRPWGAVYVDERKVADETPVYRLEVPAGRRTVKVFFPDRGTFSATRAVELAPGATRSLGFSP